MKIDRAALENRLERLTTSRAALLVQIHIHDGAIAECEHWLASLAEEPDFVPGEDLLD